jgi:carboxypeptidase Taq
MKARIHPESTSPLMTKTRKATTRGAKTSKTKSRGTKSRKPQSRSHVRSRAKSRTQSGAGRTRPSRDSAAKSRQNRLSPETKLAELKHRLREISDLDAAGDLLEWDHATYMPKRGASARARQGAILRRLAHERSIDPALGKLIDELSPYADGLPPGSDEASLIRIARRDFEKAIKVPADHVARVNELGSASFDAWTQARPANDFATMRPFLEQILDLSREYAGFFAPHRHVADPLIDDEDEGTTTASVRALFAELRRELVPMVRAISQQPSADDSCLRGNFGEIRQLAFGLALAERMGYDLARGRLDQTHHPFCTKFAGDDVRITTRVYENDVSLALFATLHEAGHALYEQGVSPALEGTPLGSGTSSGVHESQSRLWENVVARSLGFWTHFYPRLRQTFPDGFEHVPLETFYRAINKVGPSLIRGDADEVTYNLHVMLRFELELQLLEGSLRIKDLPEAWNEAMRTDFGVAPPDDRDGCLQDVHWYAGRIGGGFQSYTIGNVLSAQFYAAAVKEHPDIPSEMESGKLSTLHAWLRRHIYQHGRKYLPSELVARVTGGPMSTKPYLAYLREKYGRLYELPPSRTSETAA